MNRWRQVDPHLSMTGCWLLLVPWTSSGGRARRRDRRKRRRHPVVSTLPWVSPAYLQMAPMEAMARRMDSVPEKASRRRQLATLIGKQWGRSSLVKVGKYQNIFNTPSLLLFRTSLPALCSRGNVGSRRTIGHRRDRGRPPTEDGSPRPDSLHFHLPHRFERLERRGISLSERRTSCAAEISYTLHRNSKVLLFHADRTKPSASIPEYWATRHLGTSVRHV